MRVSQHASNACSKESQNFAWGRIVSFRVYQLMSGYMGSDFFPGAAIPHHGRLTATSPLLAHGVNSSLAGYDKFSVTSVWVCHTLWEGVGPEQILLFLRFSSRDVWIYFVAFPLFAVALATSSHGWKAWFPYVGSLSSVASRILGCVLGFQCETDKLTFRLNIFGREEDAELLCSWYILH